MKYIIKFICIAILFVFGGNAAAAQEANVADGTTSVESVGSKVKQSRKDDSWTGVYVGGFGGPGRGTSAAVTVPASDYFGVNSPEDLVLRRIGRIDLKANGINAGGAVGFNRQAGRVVIGAEADFGTLRLNAKGAKAEKFFDDGNQIFTITQSVKSDWLATIRPRVGVTARKVLIYATSGLAVARLKYAEDFLQVEDGIDHSIQNAAFATTKTGWTAGGGAEVKVAKRISIKGEYLYASFGRISTTSNSLKVMSFDGKVSDPRNAPFNHSADLKTNIIRFGVNYRF